MLHLETIEPRTFALLETLLSLPALHDFHLVGGTALALKYGHRISIDLDLFGHKGFDKDLIVETLSNEFGDAFVPELTKQKWAIFCFIHEVKVDIINYAAHPLVSPPQLIDGIRLYSDEDIMAMKINAILGRGKKKDFWDIYELLHHYSLSDFIDSHQKKFPQQMLLISIPSALTYFEDAEESEDPVSLKSQTWQEVKRFIRQHVNDFLK